MKKLIITTAIGLLIQQIVQAQETLYVSNLGQTSTGNYAVGSDSWYASFFKAGNNIGGYELNIIQLAVTGASGNPSGFTAMVYANINPEIAVLPGNSIGTLDGSLNPVDAGTYNYTPDSNIVLSPNTDYYVVLTAETPIAEGAYEWSLAGANSYNPSDGWSGSVGRVYTSSNGLSWIPISAAYPQFAITATAIPEPSSAFLLLLGSGVLFYVRKRHST